MGLRELDYADNESVLAKENDQDTRLINETGLSVPSTLKKNEREIINNIIEAKDKNELEKQFGLFNLNQSKKDALRIIKLENLLDKVENQTIARFENRPDQISNKELLDYLQVVSAQIDRSQKKVDDLSNKDIVVTAPINSTVNINVGQQITQEDKEATLDAVRSIMNLLKESSSANTLITPSETEEIEVINTETVDNNSLNENEDKISEVTPLSIILENTDK